MSVSVSIAFCFECIENVNMITVAPWNCIRTTTHKNLHISADGRRFIPAQLSSDSDGTLP